MGEDPQKLLKTVSPLIAVAGQHYASIGRDPSILQKQAEAMLTQPTGEEAATAAAKSQAAAGAITGTKIEKVKDASGNETLKFANPFSQTINTPEGQGPTAAGPKDIAAAMIRGDMPPEFNGMYKIGGAVKAELAASGFNLAKAEQEWQSAKKQILSLNGPQMVRYAGLATSVINTIDEVRSLSQELGNSGVPIANAAKLQAYLQTAGNTPQGQLAAKYLAAVNTLKEEFANLAQGGYAPTESAWKLASDQINGNYGVKQLEASLTEVQRLIRYRLQGIPNFGTLGPNAPNRYFNSGQSGGGESAAPSIPAPPPGFVIK